MEKGVAIETAVSNIICFIFDIDSSTSKSFGHQSSVLSFNAKINLLTDLKFVNKDIAREFQLFAEIRNKFAHVQYVSDFSKCFEVLKEQKNYFIKAFAVAVIEYPNEESLLASCFSQLCFRLGIWMDLILHRSNYLKTQELKKTVVIERLRIILNGQKPENGSEQEAYVLTQFDEFIKEIEQDKDFASSVEQAIEARKKESDSV